jgi:hypothetical protein
MLKPNKTFKLSKQTKTLLASITDPVKRNEWKHAMIQAELAAGIVPKREPRGDNKRPQGAANYQTNDTGTASTQV